MNDRNRADAVVMGTGSRLVDYLSIREVRQSFYEACGDDAAIYEPVFEPIRSVLERGELIHKTITDPVLRKALVATDRRVFDVRGAQLARSLSTGVLQGLLIRIGGGHASRAEFSFSLSVGALWIV